MNPLFRNNQFLFQVTGGNKGIGYAIVKDLCTKFDGAVYLTARDVGRGEEAVKNLEAVSYL
jgi:carbonyl reductase 1